MREQFPVFNQIAWDIDIYNWYLTIKRLWWSREYALDHPQDSSEYIEFIKKMINFIHEYFTGPQILSPYRPLDFYPLLALFSKHVTRINKNQCDLVVNEILKKHNTMLLIRVPKKSYTEEQWSEPHLSPRILTALLSTWENVIISDLKDIKELDKQEVEEERENVRQFLKSAGMVIDVKLDVNKTDAESPKALIMLFDPMTRISWKDNYITDTKKRTKRDTPFVYSFYLDPQQPSPIHINEADVPLFDVKLQTRTASIVIPVLLGFDLWLRGEERDATSDETSEINDVRLYHLLMENARINEIALLIQNNPPNPRNMQN